MITSIRGKIGGKAGRDFSTTHFTEWDLRVEEAFACVHEREMNLCVYVCVRGKATDKQNTTYFTATLLSREIFQAGFFSRPVKQVQIF